MKDALLAWPRLSTVRLVQLTLRLWVWAILLAALLMAVPLRGMLESLSKRELPQYMNALTLLLIAVLFDRLVDRFLSKQSFWGACEMLLQSAIKARGLKPAQPDFRNMRAQRVRGEIQTWRSSMNLLAASMSPPPVAQPGSNDAAQRVAPWAFAGGLLFAGVLLSPIWWPDLMKAFHLSALQLAGSALAIWGLASILLGSMASLVAAPWIRERCL